MQTYFADTMVIVACIAGGVLLLHLLQWVWRPSSRRGHNDVTATNVGVIGTTYAVLIAFMLSNVWTSFRAAESNAEQESNSLVNVFRIAKTLPQPERGHIQQLARDYATEVVDREWRAMGTGAEIGVGLPRPLWDAVSQIQPQSAGEQIGVDQAFGELRNLTERRRIRELQNRSRLPPLLWAVLIVGAIVTVVATCLFGAENLKLHAVQISLLCFLLTLVLVAIADIDSPFRGPVHVSPDGFRYAIETMDRESGP